MKVSYTIDWFTFTVKQGQHTRMGNIDNGYVEGRGMNGYTSSLRFLDGRIENSNPDRDDMGTQVIFSGSVLKNFVDMYKKSPDDVLEHYSCLDGKCTRIDFAIDIRNSGLEFDDFLNEIEKNRITTKTPRSKIHYHKGVGDKGWTIYIGKKSKHRFMRIYHKGHEQKTGEDWIRVELQCNVKTASRYHIGYVEASNKANYVLKVINGFISFDEMKAWHDIVGNEKIRLSEPQTDGSKTLEWIYNSVAPFLGRYIARYGDEILHKFLAIVSEERSKELEKIKE